MKIFLASENLRGILRCKTSASIPSVPNPLTASSLIVNLGEVMAVMARAPQEAVEVEAVCPACVLFVSSFSVVSHCRY
jgi:hypothetical protein